MNKFLCAVFATLLSGLGSIAWASTQWQQIEQTRFSVIFEAGLEDEAQRVTYLLNEYLDRHLAELPIKGPYRPVPVVLFTDAHTSNGNVGMPPLRSHWYNKPFPLSGTEWFDTLAVHEGRHMVQYNQLFDHKTGKVLRFFFGETGSAIFSGLFFPSWMYEGDAVVSETEMTSGGRGRNAAFNLWLRTDWLNQTPYRYDRAILGTDFERMPYVSPYDVGYYINQLMQERHDDQVLDRIIANTGTINSFRYTDAVYDATGQHVTGLYDSAVQENANRWRKQRDELTLSPVETLSKNHSDHWVSWYPVGVKGDDVFAAEVDLETGASLVSFNGGERTHVTDLPREATSKLVSSAKARTAFLADDRVCYIREVPHKHVANKQNGRLECWSETRGFHTVIAHQKLTSAAYAQSEFLAHVFLADRTSELRLYDADGHLLKRLALPKRSLAYDLAPSQGGWVFVMQTDDGHGIFHVNGALTDVTLLKAAQQENVRSPLLTNHWLLYTSDRSGIDQVMALSRLDGEAYQIATRPYGSYFIQYSEPHEALFLADYTPKGQQLVKIDFKDTPEPPAGWVPSQQVEPMDWRVDAQPPVTVPNQLNYAVSDYNLLANAWNPHSWYGWYDGNEVLVGIDSTNVMQTVDVSLDVGVQTQTGQFRFDGLANIQTESGWYLGYGLKRDAFEDTAYWLNQVQAALPVLSEHGLYYSQWAPVIALQHIQLETGASATFAGAGFQSLWLKDRAYQDIGTPFGLSERVNAIMRLNTGDVGLVSETQLTARGLSNRQSFNAAVSAQWMSDNGLSQIQPSTLFPDQIESNLSARASAQYRMNLGPVGLPLTSAAYWRNTEWSLHAETQVADEVESALGVSLTPRLNLFRNPNILIEPRLSVYYRPESRSTQWAFAFLIGGQ